MKSSNSGGASDTYTYDQLNRLSTVTDASGATPYAYDAVGNLQNFTYPNGVTHAYTYDTQNRLTQVGAAKNANSISNYACTLGVAGNRLTVAELSGRTVNYGYDSLYRLTSEAVSNDPNNHDGTTSYLYDNVGNRQQMLVNGVTANTYTYDADDRLGSDQYDPDGNTINSFGTANTYDFENHLATHGLVTLVYNGDGNRVSETVGGVTTNYLVDTQNPTGYAQVVDELQGGSVSRTYSFGLERISETQMVNSVLTASFYGYDGHGSVRQLTNATGAVTDSYDYDAFGNLTNQTGSTPNNYLFAGEQYDLALNLYYSRARYLNTTTGRFWSMDTFEGDSAMPLSLHKYLYASGNPVNRIDPKGTQDVVEEVAAEADDEVLEGTESGVENAVKKEVEQELEPEILVHATSLSNAYSINTIGLTAQEYPQLDFDVDTRFPGAFSVIALGANPTFSLGDVSQFALQFAVARFKGDVGVMVGLLPQPTWQSLLASESVVPDLVFSVNAYACLPASFPVIDEFIQGRWVITPATR